MDKELITPFYKKNVDVAIGVPHAVTAGKPFFYYGRITKLTDKYLILRFEKGIKQILLEDIVDIHLDEKPHEWEERL